MKKLLIIATLSIAVAAVIKRVTELQKQIDILDTDITTIYATQK